jgi:hypothetical protein
MSFFSILPKFLDWETLLGTLGDALASLPWTSGFKDGLSYLLR